MFTFPYPYASIHFTHFYNTKFQCYDTEAGLLYTFVKGQLTSKPAPNPHWGNQLSTIPNFIEYRQSRYCGFAFATLEEAQFAHSYILSQLKQDARDYADSILTRINKLPDTSTTISTFQCLQTEHFL